ncbi:helix-hairpin-helix domain-containing protein [Kocuria sp.]|uniref:helix-hairpin-helix domain-containing protein n=1 Tax=Kocuria sp. TaxID=1871328 RepID=UPI0026DEE7AE|nr:helix-hairpin-helix domain-containing protein [Kocuria sp.]MDO5617679.1 helix-hairpin-helix domain-containing protein [Kocuria sp.]
MSPVSHRGRRRLDPDEPVERLRGLLEAEAAETGEEPAQPPSQDHSAWRAPVRWRLPWAAVVLVVVAMGAVALSVLWPNSEGATDHNSAAVASVGVGSPGDSQSGSAVGSVTESSADPPQSGPAQSDRVQEHGAASGGASTTPETVFVHVVGQVQRPGVVSVPGDGRVQDAVEAAGGLTPGAVVDHVNLAAPVSDGAQILIPDAEGDRQLAQSGPGPGQPVTPADSPVNSAQAGAGRGSPDGGGSAGVAGTGLINLNTATVTELQTLPRVGPVMAQRIIDHREQVGGFRSVAELDDVPGIGPAMLSALTPLVTV